MLPTRSLVSVATDLFRLVLATWEANSSATPTARPEHREQLLHEHDPHAQPGAVDPQDARQPHQLCDRRSAQRPRLSVAGCAGPGSIGPQPPVAQLKHAVGERRGLRVVRDEQHGDSALLADLPQQREHFAAALCVEASRRLVGEHSLGFIDSASAIISRWRSPIESCSERLRQAPAEPEALKQRTDRAPRRRAASSSATASARRSRSRRCARAADRRSGRRTPDRAAGSCAASSSEQRGDLPAVDEHRAAVGRSSAAISFSSVVLPEPLGPYSATSSPAAICSETPSTARTGSPSPAR